MRLLYFSLLISMLATTAYANAFTPPETNHTTTTASAFFTGIDSDNDGVDDDEDLDDDNDGISDLTECVNSPCGTTMLAGMTGNINIYEVVSDTCSYTDGGGNVSGDNCNNVFNPSNINNANWINNFVTGSNTCLPSNSTYAINETSTSASSNLICDPHSINNIPGSVGPTNLLANIFTGIDANGLPHVPQGDHNGYGVSNVTQCVSNTLSLTDNTNTNSPCSTAVTTQNQSDWIIADGFIVFPPTPSGVITLRNSNVGPNGAKANYTALMVSPDDNPANADFVGEAQTKNGVDLEMDVDIAVAVGTVPAFATPCSEIRYFKFFLFDPNAQFAGSLQWSLDGGSTFTDIPTEFLSTVNPLATFDFTTCDTDSDGTPDFLDLDTDGDGCPDALESDGGFTYAQILNDTLTGGVDQFGVPNLATSGGQGIGSSRDTLTLSLVCDVDSDGTHNLVDLDSDNDGILDTDECTLPTIDADFNNWTITGTDWTVVGGGTQLRNQANTSTEQPACFKVTDVSALSQATLVTIRCQVRANGASNVIVNDGYADLALTINNVEYANFRNPDDNVSSHVQVTTAPGATASLDSFPISTNSGPYTFIDVTFPWSGSATEMDVCYSFTAFKDDWNVGATAIILADNYACDADGDGIPNHLDLDSDNDGISDILEAGGVDTNNDGVADDLTDTDGDGIVDLFDTDNGGTPIANTDSDNDGIPNAVDLDSDNDGIVDIIEAGGVDADNDGIADNLTDTDGDGLVDLFDTDDGGTAIANTDSDDDGIPNAFDIDADNDGIVDYIEAQASTGFLTPSGMDTDGDGIDDNFDSTVGFGGTLITPEDTDSDGLDDYLDFDSDDDGESDAVEGNDSDNDGVADGGSPNDTGVFTGMDSDGDGLDDGYDNDDATSNPTNGSSATSEPDNDGTDPERDWRDDAANIAGFVWDDTNADGMRDAGEPGIAGATVRVVDVNGDALITTVTTNADGSFLIPDFNPGGATSYYLEFVYPSGYTITSTPDQGGDDRMDSDADAVTNRTAAFSVDANNPAPFFGAGFQSAPLPVEMLGIGLRGDCDKELYWNVAQEIGVSTYDVEYSQTGTNWSKAANVSARNNAEYSTDVNRSGYYRVVTIDNDGIASTSDIVFREACSGSGVAMYPNPVAVNADVTISGLTIGGVITVVHVDGRIVRELVADSNQFDLPLNGLIPGVYIIQHGADVKQLIIR